MFEVLFFFKEYWL